MPDNHDRPVNRAKRPELIPNDDPRWTNKVTEVEEIKVIASPGDMQAPTKVACAECPFSKTSTPGFLGGWAAEAYRPITYRPFQFACHLTHTPDILDVENQRHCTGMCHFRANLGISFPEGSSLNAVIEAAGQNPDFFETFEDFVAYHEPQKSA